MSMKTITFVSLTLVTPFSVLFGQPPILSYVADPKPMLRSSFNPTFQTVYSTPGIRLDAGQAPATDALIGIHFNAYNAGSMALRALIAGRSGGNWGALSFHTQWGADGKVYERMRIDSAGNIGIGTTNPQSKLAVNGTITTKEVIVTNTGWSDYVFRPDYRLAPLSEINAYIQAHHHLPDIPSEADVKANGVSVGEMQAKLLAKIEELTLHMIRAEERNTRLQERNEELMRRLEAGWEQGK